MARALDNDFVLAYARKPSDAVLFKAKEFHKGVRDALGDRDYLTFLQGSYANDTALADLNDIDIVAVHRKPTAYSNLEEKWQFLVRDVTQRLQQVPRFVGRWSREDKCIRLNTGEGFKIDIIPALPTGSDPAADPITLYSVRERSERRNWPRGHLENARRKGAATSGHFKQAVRLFKYWRTCHFGARKVAPSYYVECLLYSMSDKLFAGDLASNFVELARAIGARFPDARAWRSQQLPRIAGKDNLLSEGEWGASAFEEFRSTLARALPHAEQALAASDKARAQSAWRAAFHGR